mgnify:CR=1 FL=1
MGSRKVVVTDYTFPGLERERRAAESVGAEFKAYQCKTADDVADAIQVANVAVFQFAPVTEAAIAGMAEEASLIRYGIGYDNIDVAAARKRGFPVG